MFGTFGAVASCGRLLRLSGEQLVMAFGIASSMTGGIDGQSGTMTKPLHAGVAARNGVQAALLAADGFTASDRAFDGGRSFFSTFFPTATPQYWRVTADLGNSFYPLSPGVGIKMYPAGYYLHQTFEAALQIVQDNDLSESDIASIRVGVKATRFDRPAPRSSLDAKFSLQYMAAMAVLYRRLTVDLFDQGVVFSAPVRSILSRIETYVDPTLPDNPDIAHNPVTITCVDGRTFGASVTMPRSHWRYPLPRAAWLEKFRRNAGSTVDVAAVEALIDSFDRLEELDDVAELAALLSIRSS